MICARLLKVCHTGAAASGCKHQWMEGSANNAAIKVCHLGTAGSSWKQQRRESWANSGLLHPAHCAPLVLRPLGTTENEAVRWHFPADDKMQSVTAKVSHGILSQTLNMTLNAAKPITHDLMEEALNVLYNKVESLRICFRVRQNQLWIADMPVRRLDFKSLSGSDVEKHLSDLASSSFDLHNGPLWKARLITSPADVPCHFPEVKEKFPYQYNLLFSLHHATNDGRDLILSGELLHSIVDHLLQGLPVDGKAVGELRDSIEVREEQSRIKAALENDPQRLEAALRRHLDSARHVPLLIEAFGPVSEASPSTHLLPQIHFDHEIMRSINHKCRLLGVSTNAFMTAVLNTALVEVARDAGLKRSNYSIAGAHPVDCRRLMAKTTEPALGNHGTRLIQTTATPHNVKEHFWSYMQNLNTELSHKLHTSYMCEQWVVNVMQRPEGYVHDEQYAQPLPLCLDYLFSNVYSPLAASGGNGKVVLTTSISVHVLMHKESFPLGFGFFGVRDKAFLELAYSAATVSKETAGKLLDKLVAVFHDISKPLT